MYPVVIIIVIVVVVVVVFVFCFLLLHSGEGHYVFYSVVCLVLIDDEEAFTLKS